MTSVKEPGFARRLLDAFTKVSSKPAISPSEADAQAQAKPVDQGVSFDNRTLSGSMGYGDLKRKKPDGPVTF